MNRLGAGSFGCLNNSFGVQITRTCLGWADQERFVCRVHVWGGEISLRINNDRRNTQLATGSRDTDSNFQAIGGHELFACAGIMSLPTTSVKGGEGSDKVSAQCGGDRSQQRDSLDSPIVCGCLSYGLWPGLLRVFLACESSDTGDNHSP